MADPNPNPGDNPPEGGTSGPQPTQSPAPSSAPGAITSASPPATRPPYIPQFTAATQLILKRMKGEPSSLSSALSAASVVAGSIKPSTYEDVRRRLVMGMNTSASLTMHMPLGETQGQAATSSSVAMPTPRARPSAKVAGMSAIRRISSGLTVTGKPAPPPKTPATKTLPTDSKIKKPKATAVSKAASSRRKRVKGQDGETSDLSDRSDVSEPETTMTEPAAPLTMTKSGRQVQKPSTYNPAAMDANTRKRTHYGKRTVEQALCKKCTRMHSPTSNQMVFCDGCNDGWHQMCHDPWIEDAIVRDEQRSWFCSDCVEKRNRGNVAKRQKMEAKAVPPLKESWAAKTPQQRRAYLMTLSNQELVGLVMSALEIHPDLPIFPSATETGPPRSLFAGPTVEGLFPRADANPTGQMNYVRKTNGRSSSSGPKGKNGKGQKEKEDSLERAEEDEEYDPLAPLWPKAGKGLYSRLPPDTEDREHLVDDDDYEAFSVIVYDERGRKVEENGMRV